VFIFLLYPGFIQIASGKFIDFSPRFDIIKEKTKMRRSKK